MAKKSKVPLVTEKVAKRVEKWNYDQVRHGICVVCGKGWDDCPHTWSEAQFVIQTVRTARALGLELK